MLVEKRITGGCLELRDLVYSSMQWNEKYIRERMWENNMTDRKVGLLGRLPAQRPQGLHMLSFYQHNPLPKAPDSVAVPAVADWGMLGNDKYGDCTFAGIAHAEMAIAQVLGLTEPGPTTDQVVKAYLSFTNGQDVGAVEANLLKFWQQNEIFSGKVAAYAPTDPADHDELKSIIAAYGLVYIGIEVPAPCERQFAEHKPWALTNTPADDNILGGHCIILVGYDKDYVYGITWGKVQAIEWNWLLSYMQESWAIIAPEIVTKGQYGQLRLAELLADIEQL